MIDPLTGAALGEALGGITAQISGMSLSDAYNQRMTDTYTDASGIEIGVGNYTDSKPSISGNTSNTVVDSAYSDPSVAFEHYETAGGVIDSTTGGFIYGSIVDTYSYSLIEKPDQSVAAVAPVSVPLDRAFVAITQALGVSMDLHDIDPIWSEKFSNALVVSGAVYDKAKGLVTAWWDGVNMLFPRKAVEAVEGVIEEEGIGNPTYTSYLISGVYSARTSAVGEFHAITSASFRNTSCVAYGDAVLSVISVNDNTGVRCVAVSPSGSGGMIVTQHQSYTSGGQMREETRDITVSCGGSPISHGGQNAYISTPYSIMHSTYQGQDIVTPPTGDALNQSDSLNDIYWSILYGNQVANGYPQGMKESIAPAYTASRMPSAGGVARRVDGGQGIDTIDTVPINLPVNPEDTTDSTTDPISTPTNPEQQQELPAPPIPTPVPDTNISNPDVPLVNSSVINSTLINELVEELANTLDPQPEQSSGIIPFPFMPGVPVDPSDPSSGSSYPSIVPASGSGLIHVYNPTPGEFVGFGNWLWVTYADATIEKIWNNPFDGIIGAHELYTTPQTDGRDNIRSGFLVCPVTSDLVRQRYTEIDCGTVVVPEFYGNYFDYSPYSQAYIYLPFIGINEVSVDDIVGHAVNIRYRIDAYNGSCIAMIYVAKNGYRNLCYQFGGNCAVEVPLAGGSQAAIKAGMLQAEAYARATVQSAQIQKTASIGSGIVHGAASGSGAGPLGGILGALAGGTAGYIQGAANYGAAKTQAGAMQEAARYANKSSVQHSGQFGFSHGAMGLKIPFIMIRNPIQVKVVNYNVDYGFPAHKRVIIGGCTGYLRVREVNVVSAHATNEEKIAIEEALKQGVYVTP